MKIITTPDPRLRTKSRKVNKITEETKDIIAEMRKASLAWEKEHPYELSAAMAAPQLGFNRRIIIIRDDLDDKKNTNLTERRKIKYQRLTIVKDNMIIKGKKTVDELKNDYVIAVNRYGANSIQAKSILEQMNEYGTKVLKEYYKDYLNSLPLGSNFNLTEEQFMIKINEGAKHFIKNINCYRIKNDDSTGMDVFETEYINYSNSYNFINILGYGSKIIKGFNDKEKLYFVLAGPRNFAPKFCVHKFFALKIS